MTDPWETPDQWLRGPAADAVEQALIRHLLQSFAPGRVVEIGAGAGRLLPVLSERATELYAIDHHREFLLQARSRANPERPPTFLCATARRLPLRDRSISTIVLVRVYHRLTDPTAAVREAVRVLAPGGVIVLSYVPSRSLKTFYYRFWKRLHGHEDPHPSAPTRRVLRDRLEALGLEFVGEAGCGFEELPILERLPIRWRVRLGVTLGRAPYFPSRIVALREMGSDHAT